MTLGAPAGAIFSFLLLCLLALGLRLAWRAPFRALGILVAGMAFHNLVLMVLIRLDTPPLLIRAVQAWKELLLAVLLLEAVTVARAHWKGLPTLLVPDWLAIGFTGVVITYGLVELTPAGNGTSLVQEFVSLRLALLMPLLYLLGRLYVPRALADLRFTLAAILAAAAAVGLFGLWELWLVPTRDWLQWGAVGFSRWLGFDYAGPQGLPANFFQTTSSGLLLRRMVSTYLSPLGVAYTGLLVVPMAFLYAMSPRSVSKWPQWIRCIVLAIIVLSVGLAVTRLALVSVAAECLLIALIVRRAISSAVAGGVIAVTLVAVLAYPSIGPVLNSSLVEVNSPTRFLRDSAVAMNLPTPSPTASGSALPSPSDGGVGSVLSGDDPSIRAHIQAVIFGINYILEHPVGTGLGSAVPRYGFMQGPSESALLRIGGEFGVLGALLYAAFYASVLVAGAALIRRSGWERLIGIAAFVGALGLLPISLTSDVWGDLLGDVPLLVDCRTHRFPCSVAVATAQRQNW